MADEVKSGLEIDDWLDDLQKEAPAQEDQVGVAELDQSDIDSLLGGGDSVAADAGKKSAADDAAELAQSDIDALLGGGPAEKPGPPAEPNAAKPQEDFAELDQSDIDSLLGGGVDVALQKKEEVADIQIDQSDIDDLFAGAADAPAPASAAPAEMEGEAEPSQEDVDQLFSDIDDAAGAETVSFTEVMGGEKEKAGDESFGLTEADLGDEDFGFDDNIPEIPDEETVATVAPAAKEEFFADESTAQELADYLDESTVAEVAGVEKLRRDQEKKFTPPLPIAMNKTIMSATAICVVLLVGALAYFFLKGEKHEPAVIPPMVQEQKLAEVPAEPPAEPPVNRPPVVQDLNVQMDGSLPIQLSGQDEDNDPLEFAIVSPPKFGRLSGEAPNLTYLPNKDFPGEDSFDFRASDGKDASNLAKVIIKGPVLAKEETKDKKASARKSNIVGAQDIRLEALSTEPLIIDWKKIWQKANRNPYSAKVAAEILSTNVRGTLSKISPSKHQYVPEKFFDGEEKIEYRFRSGGRKSKVCQIFLSIKSGDPAPELHLKPVAEAYTVGKSVVLDARQTKDDDPETLVFSWEQVSGVPVQMEVLNKEASMVSFVVPSFFYKGGDQQTVIRVTAIDRRGQRSSETVKVKGLSRYQSALWRGSTLY